MVEFGNHLARIGSFVIIGALSVSWIVLLAGIARKEDLCVKGSPTATPTTTITTTTITPAARKLLSSQRHLLAGVADTDCGMAVSFAWWITFLQLCVIIGIALLAAGRVLRFKLPIIGSAFISMTLLCGLANSGVLESYALRDTGAAAQGAQAMSAGAVASLIFMFLWMFVSLPSLGEGGALITTAAASSTINSAPVPEGHLTSEYANSSLPITSGGKGMQI